MSETNNEATETTVEQAAPAPAPEAKAEAPAPAPKAAAKKSPAKTTATKQAVQPAKDVVLFTSREKETHSYDILINNNLIRPYWDRAHERLIWECPAADAERFKNHHHFLTNRVVEVKE